MNRRSVRFRLTAWYAIFLTVTFAAAGAGIWFAVRKSIHDTVDRDLRSRWQAMFRQLREEPNSPEEELDELAGYSSGAALLQFRAASGEWLYRSAAMRKGNLDAPPPDQLPEQGRTSTEVFNGRPIRLLTAPYRLPGLIATAQVGIPLDEYYEMLAASRRTLFWAAPLALLLATAGGYWMSRRALEPVDAMTREAAAIHTQNLSRRLPEPRTGDELERLAVTLNAMFARLEASFERITRFTADASHELRTPVAVIRTAAELARNRPREPEEYRRALDQILLQSERASELLDSLMTLARADAGVESLDMRPMDLTECVRDACAEGRVLAEARQIQFLETTPGPLQLAAGDARALHRAILILIDNAVKYTAAGGHVEVHLRNSGGTAAIEVKDDGIGIAPADQAHIFERFYRADKARSRSTGGVGLGLSIAQWIAERHGGAIDAISAPGTGSAFTLRVPFRASSD